MFVTSIQPNQNQKNPKPCHCLLPKQFPTTRVYIKSMNTAHQFFSKVQIYLRKDIPNVGII